MKLVVSFSPHSLCRHTISSSNMTWILCGLPAALAGVYLYGVMALLTITLSILAAAVAEFVCFKILGKETNLHDNHAVLIGFFLGLTLSPATPWWVTVIAGFSAVVLGKMLFGGFGYFPFNSVIVGWVVCYLSFPELMTTYIEPQPGSLWPAINPAETPILLFRGDPSEVYAFAWYQLFLGNYPGPIGASSALAIIIGGLFLFARGYLKPGITIGYLVGLGGMAAIFHAIDPDIYAAWWWHLLVGQAMLAAFFLATEPTTSPVTNPGMLLFGLGAGMTAYFITAFGSPPDGALYGVLFFNAITPILDRLKPKPYGRVKNA